MPAIVNLSIGTDEVFLELYGSGFRNLPSLPWVSIGGMPMEVTYAGPHSGNAVTEETFERNTLLLH